MLRGGDGGKEDVEAQLRKQLESLQEENQLLMRDVENMCLQSNGGGGGLFDGSLVVSERIYSLEAELSTARSELKAVTADRNSMREDIAELRLAKRNVDSTWRTERSKNQSMEKELEFYQRQSVQALTERDDALMEVEEAKRQSLDLEKRLRAAQSQADQESRLREDLQAELDASRRSEASLAAKVAELEQLREVKAELDTTLGLYQAEQQKLAETSASASRLEAELAQVAEYLAKETRESEDLRSQLAEVTRQHKEEEAQKGEELRRLRQQLEAAETAADEADSNREEFEDSLYAARAEVEMSRKATADMEAKLAEATQARDGAARELEKIREVHQKDCSGLGAVQEQCNELKTRLAQATQEKVATMMDLANLKQEYDTLRHQQQPAGNTGRRR